MALLLNSSLFNLFPFVFLCEARNLSWQWEKKFISNPLIPSSSSSDNNKSKRKSAVAVKRIQACLNPFEDLILKDALKEPVAFMGGVFAGLLRLDLNEDPLRDWISKTVEASGITADGATAAADPAFASSSSSLAELTFLVEEACLLAGSVQNPRHMRYRGIYFMNDPSCEVLRKGVFAAGAAFVLLTAILAGTPATASPSRPSG
ncbi:hypothetical protein OPV22_030457 [Ensete ventricosum]|uniref:Uncharacterized protein n=1 Tax=Ensete ventricosum TaxID=4639 RepID=A0AAV8Q928_ENSVE|nr:hypothetical protein OPV22_030457 [Ensete ventricosum]